ncbi:MAG: response regulator [Opitutaceae bacterium]|nr:response regulator [Opitutaceae bacterium]
MALEAFAHHRVGNPIVTLRDGVEALDYLYRRGDYAGRPDEAPVVVLLDLKMPRLDGLGVLRQVKGDPKLRTIPVVVMTSSREESDVVGSYRLGVNAYVVKPLDFQQFVAAMQVLGTFWGVLNETSRGPAQPPP